MSHILEINEDGLKKFWKKISELTTAMVNDGEKASSLKEKSAILKHPTSE